MQVESTPLTDEVYWDRHWAGIQLPVERTIANSTPYIRTILQLLERFAPTADRFRVLEIGAAPGGYLAYFARMSGCLAVGLDSSPAGVAKLEANFRILGLNLECHRKDVMTDELGEIKPNDLVYSLGLIEHFTDPTQIIKKHRDLLKPGGTLAVGAPNFRGINLPLIRLLCPAKLEGVNLGAMDLDRWRAFETELGLRPLFKGYVGGWEPRIYLNSARNWKTFIPNLMMRMLARLLDVMPFRGANSRRWSGYVLGVYQVET